LTSEQKTNTDFAKGNGEQINTPPKGYLLFVARSLPISVNLKKEVNCVKTKMAKVEGRTRAKSNQEENKCQV